MYPERRLHYLSAGVVFVSPWSFSVDRIATINKIYRHDNQKRLGNLLFHFATKKRGRASAALLSNAPFLSLLHARFLLCGWLLLLRSIFLQFGREMRQKKKPSVRGHLDHDIS